MDTRNTKIIKPFGVYNFYYLVEFSKYNCYNEYDRLITYRKKCFFFEAAI